MNTNEGIHLHVVPLNGWGGSRPSGANIPAKAGQTILKSTTYTT
jgi:hypothetical protein